MMMMMVETSWNLKHEKIWVKAKIITGILNYTCKIMGYVVLTV